MDEKFREYAKEHYKEMYEFANEIAGTDTVFALAIYAKLATPLKFLEDRYNAEQNSEEAHKPDEQAISQIIGFKEKQRAGLGQQPPSQSASEPAPAQILGQQAQEPRPPSTQTELFNTGVLYLDQTKGELHLTKRISRETFASLARELRDTHDYVRGTKKGELGYFKVKQ